MTSRVVLLLIEDEVLIIDVLADAPTDSGYEALKAQNGTEALA